jgi:hypothetical protein
MEARKRLFRTDADEPGRARESVPTAKRWFITPLKEDE